MKNHSILPYTKEARGLATQLRKNMTSAEKIFWNATKKSQLGVVMRRQMPILDYVVDFYIKDLGVAIEIDGKLHDHNVLEDGIRQERIERLGVKFIRFKNDEVKNNLSNVLEELKEFIIEFKSE